MKRTISCAVLSLCLASVAFAQPIVLEQAPNVVGEGVLEVGVDNLEYGQDVTKITDTQIELTRTTLAFPMMARYGIRENIEATFVLPYVSLASKTTNAGASVADDSASNISDAKLGGKYASQLEVGGMLWDVSAGLVLSLPTGSQSSKFPAEFKKGFDLAPAFAACKPYTCPLTGKQMMLNLNLAYNMTGEYEGQDKVKYDPSDVLTLGVGVERQMDIASLKGVNLGGELLFKSLSDQKVATVKVDGSSGSQLDLVLGGRYNVKKDLKTKLGFAFSLGDEKYREYDWKVLLGVTYLTKI